MSSKKASKRKAAASTDITTTQAASSVTGSNVAIKAPREKKDSREVNKKVKTSDRSGSNSFMEEIAWPDHFQLVYLLFFA
jgi:hypothetical protein